jgi:phosphoribosylanthranilate isomerase
LFADADAEKVRATISAVGLDILQFHGEESAETYRAFGRPYIKVVRMRDDVDLHAQRRAYPDAIGLLLDTYVKHAPGGSGKTFDWRLVPRDLEKPIILAGGLTADNVKDAIKVVQPFAVDVSSGVEETKGIKDPKKISAFIERVREDQ